MYEVDAEVGRRIMELEAQGMTPDEAYRQVMKAKVPTVKATVEVGEKPKKKANTEPAAKRKIDTWLTAIRTVHEKEYRFHPTRKWRFDWFLPAWNVAIEYDGLMRHGANQGHASISGILADVEKYNAAQEAGIRVFRANAKNVEDGTFFEMMGRVLKGDE